LWSSVKPRRVRGAIITALLRGIICVRIASRPIDENALSFFQAVDDLSHRLSHGRVELPHERRVRGRTSIV